jgi:hypothetical protein
MREFWREPLSEEQKAQLIDALAQQVVKRGLSAPAILFLELHKPFALSARRRVSSSRRSCAVFRLRSRG